MKNIYFILSTLLIAFICCSCKSNKIIVIDGGNADPSTSLNAFNDERYIWENWKFSTNTVEKIQ